MCETHTHMHGMGFLLVWVWVSENLPAGTPWASLLLAFALPPHSSTMSFRGSLPSLQHLWKSCMDWACLSSAIWRFHPVPTFTPQTMVLLQPDSPTCHRRQTGCSCVPSGTARTGSLTLKGLLMNCSLRRLSRRLLKSLASGTWKLDSGWAFCTRQILMPTRLKRSTRLATIRLRYGSVLASYRVTTTLLDIWSLSKLPLLSMRQTTRSLSTTGYGQPILKLNTTFTSLKNNLFDYIVVTAWVNPCWTCFEFFYCIGTVQHQIIDRYNYNDVF